MYMNMESIIITITTMIMNVAVDMIIMTITIIMQMRCLQAGAVRRSGNLQEENLEKNA